MAYLGRGQLQTPTTLGNRILGGLGENIGSTLESLAHDKVSQKARHNESMKLQQIGFPKELADIFPSLDPKTQQDIFKQVNLQSIGQQQPQQQMVQGAVQPTIHQPSYTPEQVSSLKNISSPQERNNLARQFQQANQQATPISSEPSARFGQAAAQQQAIAAVKPQSIFNGPVDKLAQSKELADYKQAQKDAFEANKKNEKEVDESKKWLSKSNKETHGAKEMNVRLNRMDKLVDNGKLTNPLFAAALDTLSNGIHILGTGVGINLKSLQNTDSQEFEKLSNDMLKGIQDIFGSRILKTEVDNFLKTIPTLTQTDSGKKAVINNLKILNDGVIAENTIARDIIRENNGQVPPNLEMLVQEKLDPYLDELHKKFVDQTQPKSKNNRNNYPVLGGIKDIITAPFSSL